MQHFAQALLRRGKSIAAAAFAAKLRRSWAPNGGGDRECARRRRQIEAGTLRVSRIKIVRIEQWQRTTLGGSQRLYGRVYGHRSVPDGTVVYTTSIRSENPHRNTITTRNTTYYLGRPAS